MSNSTPTPLQIRGKRSKIDPQEQTITRSISLPESSWKKLDEIAKKLSEREFCQITSQEVIRRSLKYTMSRVIQNVMEGTILKEMGKIFEKYGMEIRVTPKYRKNKST